MPAAKSKNVIPIVREAALIAGSLRELGRRLGINSSTFFHWREVPARRVRPMCKATGGRIPEWRIRPDLYPRPRDARQ